LSYRTFLEIGQTIQNCEPNNRFSDLSDTIGACRSQLPRGGDLLRTKLIGGDHGYEDHPSADGKA
jgi:hypothetical protein